MVIFAGTESLMKKIALILVFLLYSSAQLFAQNDKKEEKVQVYQMQVDGGMDAFFTDTTVKLLYFPEFYSPRERKHNDTIYKFECYDSRDSILSPIKENSEIRFISEFKSYTDPVHTYKDADGKKKQLPVSSIIRRYDRVGDDKWISVDYATNKFTELKEYRNKVVRSDSLIILDPVTNKKLTTIYSYYKVEKVK